MDWQVVERLAVCHTPLSSIPDQWSCWLTHISLSPPSTAPTQPLTNNLTRCGMWLNTKAGGEQVLMNHKQPQDSGAPAPHITDCEYYYYYNHHSFVCSVISQIVWLLPKQQLVIRGLISMCKQKVCPTEFSQQSSHLGEALQVWAFLCRLGRDEKIDLWMRVGNSRTFEAKDSWDKDYLWTKGQTKKIPNNLYSICFIFL